MDVCLRSIDIGGHDGGPHLICCRINADYPCAGTVAGNARCFRSTCECAGENILGHLTIDVTELIDLRGAWTDRIAVTATARQDQH
jgi:coenzyme F420-reducing hydrogenase gamma subunit